MNITLKMLSCGHVERTTVVHGENTHEYSLWVENGAYMLRHKVNKAGDDWAEIDRIYVERVRDTTFKYMKGLFKQSIAWSGLGVLYSFSHNGVRYDVFTDGIDHARSAISKMYGMYAGALESLIR